MVVRYQSDPQTFRVELMFLETVPEGVISNTPQNRVRRGNMHTTDR